MKANTFGNELLQAYAQRDAFILYTGKRSATLGPYCCPPAGRSGHMELKQHTDLELGSAAACPPAFWVASPKFAFPASRHKRAAWPSSFSECLNSAWKGFDKGW